MQEVRSAQKGLSSGDEGTIGDDPALGSRASMGVLVTTSKFTKGARYYILTKTSVEGRDFDGVVEWLEVCRGNF
jgi:hypothetical protein